MVPYPAAEDFGFRVSHLTTFPSSPIPQSPATITTSVTGNAVAQYNHWLYGMSRTSVVFIPKMLDIALRGKKMMVTMVKAKIAFSCLSLVNSILKLRARSMSLAYSEYRRNSSSRCSTNCKHSAKNRLLKPPGSVGEIFAAVAMLFMNSSSNSM